MFNRRKPDEGRPEEPGMVAPAEAEPDFLSPSNPPPDFLVQSAAAPEDDGLGVPPYRPNAPALAPYQLAALKETTMARSPFAPPLPPAPASTYRQPSSGAPSGQAEGRERRTLVVGRGISVQGTVQDAERLVVEGTMEATMINGLTELAITHGGVFKGEVEVDEAEVAGTIDGTLTARNALIIRATGRVLGTARCRRLQVEDGGQITGRIEMLGDSIPAPVHAPAAPAYAEGE
jgi:cytoskeletal protein CcmA (bactofilin family)